MCEEFVHTHTHIPRPSIGLNFAHSLYLSSSFFNAHIHTLSHTHTHSHLLQEYMNLLLTEPAGIESGLGDWMALEPKAVPLTGRGFQLLSYRAGLEMAQLLNDTQMSETLELAISSLITLINDKFLDESTGSCFCVLRVCVCVCVCVCVFC